MNKELTLKQIQFNEAMKLYQTKPVYILLGKFISLSSILFQILLLVKLFSISIPLVFHLLAFLLAYIFTDFINGLIHMFLDNNSNYTSIVGPLIANFHLHHKKIKYPNNNLFYVYFNETGSKVWLIFYLVLLYISMLYFKLPAFAFYFFTYFGILSSIAEVSHYLCHNNHSKFVRFLGNFGFLLSKRHHAIHHTQDNLNYAFLNGMSDPLINFIAKKLKFGYKNGTDKHYELYLLE